MEWVYKDNYEFTITKEEMLKRYVMTEIKMGANPFWHQIFDEIATNAEVGKFKTKFKAKELEGFKQFISDIYERENKKDHVLIFTILKYYFINVIKGLGYDIEINSSLQKITGFSNHQNNESLDELDKVEFEISLF